MHAAVTLARRTLLLALLAARSARAQTPMRMVESFPAANAIMDGKTTHFSVMFDRPLDHAASRLFVERDGAVVQTLSPRLNSQPNTLYADGHPLPPGRYTLRWDAHGLGGNGASAGSVGFGVAGGK